MEPLRRAFRGYDPAQVDRQFTEFRSQIEGLSRELELLRAQNERLSTDCAQLRAEAEQFRAGEAAITEALVSAHRRSDEVLAEARKEAEVLLQVARETGARMQDDLRGRISDLNWHIERLSLQKQKFEGEFRSLLEGYLGQLVKPEQPRLDLADASLPPEPEAGRREEVKGHAVAKVEEQSEATP
jgi:cell division septum initiation protein DivIVA